MNTYKGVIIEESLANKNVLKKVKIVSTKIEQVTDEHQTPWLAQAKRNATAFHWACRSIK